MKNKYTPGVKTQPPPIFRSTKPKLKWYSCVRVGKTLGLGAGIVISDKMPFLIFVIGRYNIIVGPHR